MIGKELTHIEVAVSIRQIRLIDDYLVKDFIRPLTDKDIRTIITQKSWSRIKTVEGAVRKFRKQAIESMEANSMEDEKRFVLTVRQDRTWEVVIHAESEEKAKERFKVRGIRDEHRYVSDYLINSNITIDSIYREDNGNIYREEK